MLGNEPSDKDPLMDLYHKLTDKIEELEKISKDNTAKDPLEDLYDKIEDLLLFAESKSGQHIDPSKIPRDIEQRLKNLRQNVQAFKALTNQLIANSGATQEEIEARKAGNHEGLAPDNQYLLKKGDELIRRAKSLKEGLKITDNAQLEPQPEQTLPQPEHPPLSPRKRKSKFKRFGSDKNWKPL